MSFSSGVMSSTVHTHRHTNHIKAHQSIFYRWKNTLFLFSMLHCFRSYFIFGKISVDSWRDNFSFFVLLLLFQNEFHTQIASHARRIIFIKWLTLFIFVCLYFSLFRTFHTISQVQRTNSIQTIMICINNAPICDSAPDNCLTSNQIGLQFKSTMYNENPIIRI